MPEIKRTLNDGFIVEIASPKADERRDYVPGDVDREKVYAVWVQLFETGGRSIPTNVGALLDLSDKYADKALALATEGNMQKAYGYGYFAALLGLRVAMMINKVDNDLAMRRKLRLIEKKYSEEQLLPKLLTAK